MEKKVVGFFLYQGDVLHSFGFMAFAIAHNDLNIFCELHFVEQHAIPL